MSDKEVKNEKVMTKYDRKMERRKEQKMQEQKEEKVTTAVIVLMLVAFVAFIASFPIRSYLVQHETCVTINGEDVKRVEFDYNYNNQVNNYVNQWGSYLSMFGLDVTQDLSTQMYDENLTWKDYFEEMTVDSMKETKGMKAAADAAGFDYDASAQVAQFKDAVATSAESAGISEKEYVKQRYGQYASVGAISKLVAEDARINAYYEEVSKGMVASDEDIEAYYNEHAMDYAVADYYVSEFAAEITSESPTEEEIEAAMNAACDKADAAVEHVKLQGDEKIGVSKSKVYGVLGDWLFDETRNAGDKEVILDEDNNKYYAVEFVKTYRNEATTANVRVIVLNEDNGQAVLDEWNAGAATQESFAELCKKYTIDSGAVATGGLLEGVSEDSISGELAEWIFADERGVGDTTSIAMEEATYVLYYVGQGEPEWKVDIAAVLLNQRQSEYRASVAANATVEDKKGVLNYLKVRAELEAVSGGDAVEGDASEGDVSAN